MKYRAVVFDLDGTLLDTLEDLANATNAALREMALPVHEVEAYRYFVGDGLRKLVERALPAEREGEADFRRAMALFREHYGRNWKARTRLYDGVPDMLDAMTERNLPLAVLSNKPHEFTVRCVGELLGRWSFAAVQGVNDATPPKPEVTGALAAAARLGAEPAEILYLGDTGTDMRTAAAAGMFPVGATWGFRTEEELRENGAAVIARHPRDVLELL